MCQTCQDSAGILVLERTRSEPSNAACRIHSPRPRRSHDERISSSLVIKYISNHHEISLNDPHHRRRGGKEVPRNYRQDNLRCVQRGFPPVGLGGHVSHLHTLPQTIPAEDDERQYPTRHRNIAVPHILSRHIPISSRSLLVPHEAIRRQMAMMARSVEAIPDDPAEDELWKLAHFAQWYIDYFFVR